MDGTIPTTRLLASVHGIGALLCQGIGDTMRVSLTADPVQEVLTAKDILKAAGLRKTGVNIVAFGIAKGDFAYEIDEVRFY